MLDGRLFLYTFGSELLITLSVKRFENIMTASEECLVRALGNNLSRFTKSDDVISPSSMVGFQNVSV